MKLLQKSSLLLITIFTITLIDIHSGLSEETTPLINEIMSSNASTIKDEDGDYSDWIEIYNPGDLPIDLAGYGLSDRADDPFKWIFPELILDAEKHLLVFASGKDRTDTPNHWETVITQDEEWKYFVGINEPPEDWRFLKFDDSGWDSGSSGFGFGDNDDETIVRQVTSFYIRKTFNVEDIANIIQGILQIDYDDAFVAYLNGTEFARANFPGTLGTPPPYNQTSVESREAKMYTGGNPSVFSIENIQALLVEGENIIAIQVHNYNILDDDMTAIPFLTFGMTSPPSNSRGTPDNLTFSLNNFLHTNFKIKATGETLVISDNSGNICDQFETGNIPVDLSRGRQLDGGTQWLFFTDSTPENSNITTGQVFADSVTVSQSGGFYNSTISLTLSCNSSTAVIRYTKDGSDPTESSDEYYASISITETTVIKARAFKTGLLPGKIISHTYFINEKSTLPIISIATDPDGFFSNDKGIYLNFRERAWERKVHLEYYEPNGHLGFSVDAGSKIHGKSSSSLPQKSLSVFVGGRYGYDSINYQIFPDSPITEFKSLILRNSGNDWWYTMFRDGLNSSLFKSVDLDIQAYRPCVLYINGEYWGIHNIREKFNEEYFESHHGVDPDNIDLLELHYEVARPGGALLIEGDYEHYDAMLDYIVDHDLSVDEHYNYIKTQIDIPSYINYLILEIHGGNKDWLGRNVKLWRPKTPGGKWRWLPFDLDFTFDFGAAFSTGFGFNTLAYATNPSGGKWPPWTTFVFRKLLENQDFKNDFTNRFSDCMNTFLQTSVVMQKIHEVKSTIEPEMPNNIERWRYLIEELKIRPRSMDDWHKHVQRIEEFCETRVDSLRTYISDEFNLSGTAQVTLNISHPGTGKVILNTLTLDEFPCRGIYFKDVPVRITAQPEPGYRFTGWSGIPSRDTLSTQIYLTDDLSVTAHFEADSSTLSTIVINEINYNSSSDFDTEDWIEFYNVGDSAIDISNWIFKDDDDTHKFVFSENTVIGPENYLVLCRDTSLFTTLFPDVPNYIGDMSFGLSSRGELIRIFDAHGEIVDSLTYDNNPPWSEAADGGGATLSLSSPEFDNFLAESWTQSEMNGTPGTENETITGVDETILPIAFSLGQNYPNPFNPSTTIPFSIPNATRVTIEIYSILGQRVAKILDKNMDTGHYNITFKADDLASGIYFYTIKAGKFFKTKQMMFLK